MKDKCIDVHICWKFWWDFCMSNASIFIYLMSSFPFITCIIVKQRGSGGMWACSLFFISMKTSFMIPDNSLHSLFDFLVDIFHSCSIILHFVHLQRYRRIGLINSNHSFSSHMYFINHNLPMDRQIRIIYVF